jgi:tellurite resistance protein
VTVAGREIGGMVYVGKPPLINKYGLRDKCRAYIDLSLPVARAGTDRGGQGMPYWPGYSDISPQCRATYLDWLANGRSDPSYDPGYMFLYFYGIERRFFVDSPSHDEKADLLQEVRRLSALYPENRSVQRYLGEFIQVAEVATSSLGELQPIFENPSWELPFSLKMALGARIEAGDPLGADWALSWLICHPDYSLRTPATRCPEEFKALFRLRFERTYPDGLKFSRPRKTLVATYRAASSEFDGTLAPEVNGKPVPDVSGLRKPVDIALQIAEEVMNDLDKFSRFLGRNPDGRGSVEAHALLPVELWPLFPSEEVGNLKAWASSIVTGGGLISVADVIARLEDAVPAKIGKRQLTDAADALARLGFGLAPDPRFALRSPKPGEQVVIFELGQQVEMLEEVSLAYRSALMEVALASFVAHADGHIAELERKSLMDRISSVEGLNAQESRRLRANLDWFLAVPPDLSLLRRKLKDLGPAHHAAMRAALVTTAHADGVIGSEEVAGIERVYKALGLDSGLVYSDLHAGEVDSSPRAVRAAPPGPPGEAIPAGKTPAGPALDASRIAAIRSDTERVSSVLGEVFSDNDEADEDATEEVPSILKGLDYKHAALVRELIERERWTEEEFEQLCARHKLLVAGALEAVNEWAFEFYDEALLDDYDGYEIAADVAVPLRIAFEKESRNVEIEAT